MSRKRLVEFVFCISAVAALTLTYGCAGLGAKSDADTLRVALRKARTPEERERLLQPGRLSSIGDTVRIYGVEPLACAGVGLVTGLGTNGADKGGIDERQRSEIEKILMVEEGRTVADARAMFLSRDSSMVQVAGEVPPGAQFGSAFDIRVTAIDSAVSLQNGYLHSSPLRYFVVDNKGETQYGRVVAHASGPLTVARNAQGAIVSAADARAGAIFEGGRYEDERILLMKIPKNRASASQAVLMEYLINQRFGNAGREPGMPSVAYAGAMANNTVTVRIPPIYRRYVERYADVIKHIKGSYYYGPPEASQLEKMAARLKDRSQKEKYEASVELEAVGPAAIPHLESVMDKGDEWTALYAAQALAYLGSQRGADKILALTGSADEAIRFEAVKFAGQLASRRAAVQALKERIFDQSPKIAVEAVNGLIAAGEDSARRVRLSQFDLVAVPGAAAGLVVKSTGRPMVVVTGPGTILKGPIAVNVAGIGIGSVDDTHAGIVTGEGSAAETIEVEATAESILASLARLNPPFDTVKKVIQALEDAGNIPYKITWLE